MPIDEHGNRADVIVDDASPSNRSNLGRLYYHYFSSCSREVQYNIRHKLNLGKRKTSFEELATYDINILTECYNYLLTLYKIVDVKQFEYYSTRLNDEEKIDHLVHVLNTEVYLRFTVESEKSAKDVVKELEQVIQPLYKPVKYRDQFGNSVTTILPIRIAPVYMMLLEKTPEEYSSVSSGKLQITGVLASLNKTDRYRYPYKNTSTKFVGETENRLLTSYCDPVVSAEIFDRSNSPITQEHLVKGILKSDKPFCEENLIDRNLIGYGGSKSLQMVNHMLKCSGVKLVYEPEENI